MKQLIYALIVISLYGGCSERKTPKESELKKYPWMEIFTPGRMNFEGIEHNLDLGVYSFSFNTCYSSIDTFFKITDEKAVKNNWDILTKTLNSRKYIKKSTLYTAAEGFDIITLSFIPDDEKIIFTSILNQKY